MTESRLGLRDVALLRHVVTVAISVGLVGTTSLGCALGRGPALSAPPPPPTYARVNEPGDIPVATAPAGLLRDAAVSQIQERLVSLGDLDPRAVRQGQLGDATRAALAQFQRRAGLPETGLPTYGTVQRLGLDPNQTFERGRSLSSGVNEPAPK